RRLPRKREPRWTPLLDRALTVGMPRPPRRGTEYCATLPAAPAHARPRTGDPAVRAPSEYPATPRARGCAHRECRTGDTTYTPTPDSPPPPRRPAIESASGAA